MKVPSSTTLRILCCAMVLLVATVPLFGQPAVGAARSVPKQSTPAKPERSRADSASAPAFRIDQPGTITFTVGMVIKGKIEKPQVIIFLPKEKTYYRDLKFTHSFAGELSDPLPFTPILE